MRQVITVVALSLAIAVPVVAGPLEDAEDARARGDYATALRLFQNAADQGDAAA